MNNPKTYKTVFFDLDHTLWDYETNSANTLKRLHADHLVNKVDSGLFQEHFQTINHQLWDDYARGLVSRDHIRMTRFRKVFDILDYREYELADHLSREYTKIGPTQKGLIQGTIDLLNYLCANYQLFVITNGFEDIQHQKLYHSGISHFFRDVITSEKAGFIKPYPEIFDYALRLSNNHKNEVLMVGDNLISDVRGAINASIDVAYYNPSRQQHSESTTYEIERLSELKGIL